MLFRLIYDESLAQAAYLLACQRTGEAILIDPERDIDRYLRIAETEKVRITAVAETHIHADFLSGCREVAEKTGAKVYVSGMGGPEWQSCWVTQKRGGGAYAHHLLNDGDVIRIGGVELTAKHTPGHTPEHVCYLVRDTGSGADDPMGVISGDFVFVGDVGRPDLLETAAGVSGAADSSAHALYRSAQWFMGLPDYLQVWPGHGAGSACGKALGAVPQSTVGYEKRFNPALRAAASERDFVGFVLTGQPEPPLYFARMKRENREGPAVLGDLPRPRELSPAEAKSINGLVTSVIDLRPWAQFKAGHIDGAFYIPPGSAFATEAGSYIDPASDVVLVCEASEVEEAVRRLVRVGVDRVTGFLTPAALAASGLRLATSKEIDIEAFRTKVATGEPVLDVRSAAEHADGHIAGSKNITHTRLPARLAEAPRGGTVYVHCKSGGRSARAVALLQRQGIDAVNVAGGFSAWEKSGGKVER